MNAAEIAVGRGDRQRGRALYERSLASADGVASIEWTAHAGLAQIAALEHDLKAAARHFEAALGTVDKTRSDLLKVDYKLSFLTQLIEFYRAYVDVLVAQGQNERALEVAESSRARVLAERQRVSARATQPPACLARGSRTVLLCTGSRHGARFCGSSAVRCAIVDLPPQSEIEAAVRDYQAMLGNVLINPIAASDTPGDRLFRMLVAPATLPPDASIIVVPDGALHGLNFETLPVDGPRRHYFIEDAEIQIAPSLAMLDGAGGALDPGSLLIGNPTPRAPEFRPALRVRRMSGIVRHFPADRVTAGTIRTPRWRRATRN
jgi:hypothetical protein